MKLDGISFIINKVDFEDGVLPFQFNNDILFRAASEYEIGEFNKNLHDSHGRFTKLYLSHFEEENINRYWVLTYKSGRSNEELDKRDESLLVKNLCNLLNSKLLFGYDMLSKDGKISIYTGGSTTVLHKSLHESQNEYIVSSIELNKIKLYYEKIISSSSEHFAEDSLKMYFESSILFLSSHLLTLSLFAIIESLITHKPRSAETLDSINHQIKNKIILLSKRFDLPIDHKIYFDEMNFLKSLNLLYALRSDIAHGQSYTFSSGAYQILKSLENVNRFLDEVVREIIKLAIDDTELIKDIKAC